MIHETKSLNLEDFKGGTFDSQIDEMNNINRIDTVSNRNQMSNFNLTRLSKSNLGGKTPDRAENKSILKTLDQFEQIENEFTP